MSCDVCKKEREVSTDYSPDTGLPRGFLCPDCMAAVHYFKTPEALRKTAEFLENEHPDDRARRILQRQLDQAASQ